MLDTLKQLFGFGPKADYAVLVKQGAVILDVRDKRGIYKWTHQRFNQYLG